MLDRTQDLMLAAFLVTQGFSLQRIDGPHGRREFVFDREIPPDLEVRFGSSREKYLLDTFRNLKVTLTRLEPSLKSP
jgi:hypothetical protein